MGEAALRIVQESGAKSNGVNSISIDHDAVTIVVENLKTADSILTVPQESAIRQVQSRIDKWKFDTTGRVDVAPKLDAISQDLESLRLTQFDMNVIRQVAFAQRPSELHSYTTVYSLSEALFGAKEQSESPCAVITVGAPGSGKDYVSIESPYCCLDYLNEAHGGPQRNQFVVFDPDYWISNLCNNRNEHRDVANFLNLEQFFYAVGRKHHLVFNGTGKDVKNTLGRVTSRLREANYRIFFCIVLARFSTVLDRIEQRRRKTGRDVPTSVVRSIFQGLQKSVPLYLGKQAEIAEALFVYDNSANEARQSPNFVVSRGLNPADAIALSNSTLALPPETK